MKRYIVLALAAAGLLLVLIPGVGPGDAPEAKQPSMKITCGSCP
jgi:hypothetical protein